MASPRRTTGTISKHRAAHATARHHRREPMFRAPLRTRPQQRDHVVRFAIEWNGRSFTFSLAPRATVTSGGDAIP
jgi:hypothetical protein